MLDGSAFAIIPQFALLLIGPPFAGKTNVAMLFPDPWFADGDDKLRNAVQRNPGKKFYFNCPMRTEAGVPVPLERQWEEFTTKLKEACASPLVKTIVLDSVSSLSTMLIAHILKHGEVKKHLAGEPTMEKQHWLPFRDLWKKVIMLCRASGKMLVVIAHDDLVVDEVTGASMIRPLIAGELKHNLGGLFTDLWHAETRLVPDGKGGMKSEYFVRTQPTPRLPVGNSLNLPAEFIVTWDGIRNRLEMVGNANKPTELPPPPDALPALAPAPAPAK